MSSPPPRPRRSPRIPPRPSYTTLMSRAPTADAGRSIIRAHELSIERLERSLSLTPSCGHMDPHWYRGFSTLSAQERAEMYRRMRRVSSECATILADLIMDGAHMEKRWEVLLAEEMRGIQEDLEKEDM